MTMTDEPRVIEGSEALAAAGLLANPIPGYGENSPPAPPAAPAQRHYPTKHCDVCDKDISSNNFGQHQLKNHGIGRKRPFKPRNANGKDKPVTKPKNLPAVVEPTPVVEDDAPLTVDGIMGTLVEIRWPHQMPTKKALEMLDIRTALEKFLA